MTAEQDGDGQARSRFELIDFPDSKLYSPIEAALPDRAAMPPRSLMNIFLEWISPILFGFGTPIVMVFVGRAMILNRDGDRSKPSVAIPASGKSKKAQGAVNVYGGGACIRWSKIALALAATFLFIAIFVPIHPTLQLWLIQFAVPMSSLLTVGSIIETAIWAQNLPRSEQAEDSKPDNVLS